LKQFKDFWINYSIIAKINLSIKENDFTTVIGDLQMNPLTIPVTKLDSDSESENISITPKKKKVRRAKQEIDIGEYIVPIPETITSEKKIQKILKREGKRIANVLKRSNEGITGFINSMNEDESISDVSMDSSLARDNTQEICLLKDEIKKELGKQSAGLNHGIRAA
jgi:hypothetical protein